MATGNGTSDAERDMKLAREELGTQIAALKADIAGLTESLADLGQAGAGAARDRVRERASEIRRDAGAAADSLSREADRLSHATGEAVGRNPMAALGMAAAAGFVVGLLTGRK